MGYSNQQGTAEGSFWTGVIYDGVSATQQCKNNSLAGNPEWMTVYLTRSPQANYEHSRITGGSIDGLAHSAYEGDRSSGIKPACNIPSTVLVEDSPDEDGCYNLLLPQTLTQINYPISVSSSEPFIISWSESEISHPTILYRLEKSVNSGDFTQVYIGTDLQYEDTLTLL